MTEKQITAMMKTLKISRDEAIELIKEDEQVDKMTMKEVDNDLTAEQKKAKKDATKTTSGKAYKFTKRERKPDEIKREIIDTVAHNLDRACFGDNLDKPQNIAIANPEREITFTVYGIEYSLTLTKHRAKKES